MLRVRFAPSPTGDLHVGGAWTALASWALARAGGGTTVLRVEDLDPPRVVAGSAARIEDDLAWLGLDWDEGSSGTTASDGPHAPYTQSARAPIYEAALARLEAAGLTYPCDCSRAEIARAASAPHDGEEVIYPGTCRDAPKDRPLKRLPAIRVRVPEGTTVAFDDLLRGHVEQRLDLAVGDFVLRRGDGVFAYQLAVAIDDAMMRISHVVRGADLLSSTARQIWLMRVLGFEDSPRYAHLPLVVAPEGARLAKRIRSATIRSLQGRGLAPEVVVGTLAHGLGLARGEKRPMTAREVAAELTPVERWRRDAWSVPVDWT